MAANTIELRRPRRLKDGCIDKWDGVMQVSGA